VNSRKLSSILISVSLLFACGENKPKTISIKSGTALITKLASDAYLKKAKESIKTVSYASYLEQSDEEEINIDRLVSTDIDIKGSYLHSIYSDYNPLEIGLYKQEGTYYSVIKTNSYFDEFTKSTVTKDIVDKVIDSELRILFPAPDILKLINAGTSDVSFAKKGSNIIFTSMYTSTVTTPLISYDYTSKTVYELNKVGLLLTESTNNTSTRPSDNENVYTKVTYNKLIEHTYLFKDEK
jgi:hypothetical protein